MFCLGHGNGLRKKLEGLLGYQGQGCSFCMFLWEGRLGHLSMISCLLRLDLRLTTDAVASILDKVPLQEGIHPRSAECRMCTHDSRPALSRPLLDQASRMSNNPAWLAL